MGSSLGVGLGLAMVCSALVHARPARACSQEAPPRALVGYPADGAGEIPTDVVPFYDSVSARVVGLDAPAFRLESMSGEVIPVTSQSKYVWSFTLTPAQLLEPQTTYTLTASVDLAQDANPLAAISFTTGAGPMPGPPTAPRGKLTHYQFDDDAESSCSPAREGTCVSMAQGLPVEVTHIDEFDQESSDVYLHTESWFGNLSGINQGTNDRCVRLRSRSPNGEVSAPVDLCGADAPLAELDGSENIGCNSAGLTQDGEVVDPGCACTFTDRRAGAGGAALAALVALALFARRRSSSSQTSPG